eukprot:363516-Chlamydomonas_euryale.AAC.20
MNPGVWSLGAILSAPQVCVEKRILVNILPQPTATHHVGARQLLAQQPTLQAGMHGANVRFLASAHLAVLLADHLQDRRKRHGNAPRKA